MKTNNIKEIRIKRGMTQQELADAIGVSVPRISEWENCKFITSWKYMLKLSEALNSSVDELFVRGCENVK